MASTGRPQSSATMVSRVPWGARLQEFWFSHRSWIGYLFILPWLAAFFIFDLMPFVVNLLMSFTDYQIGPIENANWIGLDNYVKIFQEDELFIKSLYNTVYYLVFSVPLGLLLAFMIALLLNTKVRGVQIFRTLFYVPSVVPIVAATVIFSGLLNTRYGLINHALVYFGMNPIRWLSSPEWTKRSLIILSMWGFGAQMIIFLAGLQGVPEDLHEAVAIDGGNMYHRFRYVTIPFMTPTILFNLLIGTINGFQAFVQVYVLVGSNGGPLQSSLFYMLHVYNKAFRDFEFAYAAALSVILFLIVLVLTMLIVFTSNRWVFYNDSGSSDEA